jgi:hypothetical protein
MLTEIFIVGTVLIFISFSSVAITGMVEIRKQEKLERI